MISTLIAGPGGEPLTLAEAKAWCRIDGDDEDALVTALIAAARLQVESAVDMALLPQTWRLAVAVASGAPVPLPVRPLRAIVAATLDGLPATAVIDGDGARLSAMGGGDLVIDYEAGFDDAAAVPATLRQAVLLLVGYWFANRDAEVPGPPAGLEPLLAPYRRVRL